MHVLPSSFTVMAVSAIYLIWRTYDQIRPRHGQTLHERVAYMLWMMANTVK
jgi:hypothetical protein